MSRHQPFRLASGGSIDRSTPISFRWEGRTYEGYAGDTLASALMANGLRVLGRSFKYHRPRGLIGAGVEECNVLVQLGEGARSTPNVRATEVRLHEGMVARPVNCWPTAGRDLGGVNNLVSKFLAAGFYYKTFMWPSWHFYEGFIRRAAGLGKVAKKADPDRYESRFAHCDVLVVGAGPAGLAAAVAAGRRGARVVLVEQDDRVGGALLQDDVGIDGDAGPVWAERMRETFEQAAETRLLLRTAAIGYQDHNSLMLVEEVGDERSCAADPRMPRFRTWLVRAKQVVLATGSIERPLVFSGNDRPGVMLASATRRYCQRFGVLPGRRTVVFTNNDDAYRTASALHDAGASVAAVVDTREDTAPDLSAELQRRGISHLRGAAIVGTRGGKSLSGVLVREGGRETWIACDHLAMSGGYNPTVHLFSQSGGRLRFDDAIAAYVPAHSMQSETSVGAANGTMSTAGALREGDVAGGAGEPIPYRVEERAEAPLEPIWEVAGGRGKAFVDFQNDVAVSDIALSDAEGFRSVEHFKRYTTLGMATDQGKTSNVNALAIMAALTGRSIEQTGHTRYRFPYVPIALGAMAGRTRGPVFRPLKRLPAEAWHQDRGAVFEEFGGWSRPACYLRHGESRANAERREALAVRNGVGLFDGSPLGKIEVKGRDAARFLDLVYANAMSTLKQGKVRYGLMLGEQGVVLDDGVATRLADDHFLVGTSSGGADRVAAWLEEWLQCEWLDLAVLVTPVTPVWAVATVTGPLAKRLMRDIGTGLDLDAFPHMSFAETIVGGIEARLFRVSYTGETSYEINVRSGQAERLFSLLADAGRQYAITPVGIDAWDVLRAEKGYLHLGADTDGTTNALDVGWGHVLKKPVDFIGKRSLLRPADQRPDRLNFVGLAVPDGEDPLPLGAHVVDEERRGVTGSGGYVTFTTRSPALGRPIALAMVKAGRSRIGERVTLRSGDAAFRATIVNPTFYDKDGERLRG